MALRVKPRAVDDIGFSRRGQRLDAFSKLPPRVNLSFGKTASLPVTMFCKGCIVTSVLMAFIVGSVAAPTVPTLAADTNTNSVNQEERAELEEQLRELEAQITQYEGQVRSYQRQGSTLKTEVAKLNDKITLLNLRIKSINLTLSRLDENISETQRHITTTEEAIERKRDALGGLVLNMYQNEQAGLIEIFLKNPRLSDFFHNLNNLALLQNNVRITIAQISDLRDELQGQRDEYALARADAATVRAYELAQKGEVDALKVEKNELIKITKGQETKYQTLLEQTKQSAAQIRSRIFQLLGGGEMSFEQAYEFAKFASQATGVRPAFLLAVLDRESALGRNVGRCSYTTAMSPSNQVIFLDIVKRLNLAPDSVMVSCPNADGIYGGALGPAQFIPSTWVLYEDEVARITGSSPASPWNNASAFVAAALYLRDAGAAENELRAAARYYCGSRWNRYVCTEVYGKKVVEHAAQFQEDIDTILGG